MDGDNWYVYCGNSQVKFIDPTGMVAYEKIKSEIEAVRDWAYNYYGQSKYVRFEWASLIFSAYDENGNLYYSYTYGVVGSVPHTSEPEKARQFVPDGATVTAAIHSHPVSGEGSFSFSDNDRNYAQNKSLTVYMVTMNTNTHKSVDVKRYYYDGEEWSTSTVLVDQEYAWLTDERKEELYYKFGASWERHVEAYRGRKCYEGFNCWVLGWPFDENWR